MWPASTDADRVAGGGVRRNSPILFKFHHFKTIQRTWALIFEAFFFFLIFQLILATVLTPAQGL